MKRRSRAGREPIKGRRHKAAKPTLRNAPKAKAPKSSHTAEEVARLTRENVGLLSELRECLQQRTATSEVLSLISRSTFDLAKVLNTVLELAAGLSEADKGVILRNAGGASYYAAATYRHTPEFIESQKGILFEPGRSGVVGRVLLEGKSVQISDVFDDPEYVFREFARRGSFRTILGVPLIREGTPIGLFVLHRAVVRPFNDKQIKLVETFADQAVIAIENARLLNELRQRTTDLTEALEQQTATSDVLGIISNSPGDLQPVFDVMLTNATRLCGASYGTMWLHENEGQMRMAARYGPLPEAFSEKWRVGTLFRPSSSVPTARVFDTRQPVQVRDLKEDRSYSDGDPLAVASVNVAGIRSLIAVPMLKENAIVGALTIYRQEVRPFTDKQIELVTNFAAQAVIAIENARLLNELRQRTDDLSQRTTDLTEALEQQTATSEVLTVISSFPGDLQPVFDAMLANATRLCEATHGHVWTFDGEQMHAVAVRGDAPFVKWLQDHNPVRPILGSAAERIVQGERFVHVADRRREPAYRDDQTFRGLVDASGIRASLSVALRKGETLLGMINVYRQEVRPFTDKQIELVENFAAQAVIAIENARLLNELRQRTTDLTEALEQQTATSDVLRVISSSPGQLDPVFETILANATRICDANFGILNLYENGTWPVAVMYNVPEAFAELRRRQPKVHFEPEHPVGRVAATKEVLQLADIRSTAGYREKDPSYLAFADIAGGRTLLVVPMLKGADLVGTISIFRQHEQLFNEKQIDLVKNFAAQAVIAIENARLLNELRESLQQQTATADVLKVISRSTFDLPTVLHTLTESAARLCVADKGIILLADGDVYRLVANYGFSPEALRYAAEHPVQRDHGTLTGRVALEGKAIQIRDVLADPEYRATGYQQAFGYRTALAVPLLREEATIGVFFLSRDEVNPFNEKQIELVTTFADQAVIAIENARLLNELRQRTDDLTERTADLTEALEQQTATSEVLQVISSSPGDLEPVFATMLENAVRICDATFGNIYRWDGDALHLVATHNTPPAFAEARRSSPFFSPGPKTVCRSHGCDQNGQFTSPILRQNRPTLKTAIRQLLLPSNLVACGQFLLSRC